MGCGASANPKATAQGPINAGKSGGAAGFEQTGIVPQDGVQKVSSANSAASQRAQAEKNAQPVPEPENEPQTRPQMKKESTSEMQEGRRNDTKKKQIRRQRGDSASDGKISARQPSEVGPENRKFLNKVLQKHFLFAGLEDDERDKIIDYMLAVKATAGETIFTQGQKGDCCYIIQSGIFPVAIDDRSLKQLKAKHTFGELAMLYNVNRTATVTCKEDGVLWQMDGATFRSCMEKLSSKHLTTALNFLDLDPTFSRMNPDDRKRLAGACTVQVFGKDSQILREGEVGDWMFIVIEGNVQTVDRHGNLVVKKPGTILGSAGLMYTKQQVCGAKAIDNVMCLALGKSSLERLIGPVEEVLRNSAIKALLVDDVQNSSDLSFFKRLTDEQQTRIISKFEDCPFAEGEVIITPGARAQLIIVIEGEVAVVPPAASEDTQNSAESAKKNAKMVLTAGQAFGGKALLDNSTMQDRTVAITNSRIHRIGYDMVCEALEEPLGLQEVLRLNEIKKVLFDIFLFKNLQEDQINKVVRSLERRRFEADEFIFKQGDEARHFFLIQSGNISVTKDGQEVRTLGRWDYLGERALLLQDKRSASCKAKDTVICFMLEAQVFIEIVGIFRKVLEHRMHLQDLHLSMEDLRTRAIVGRGSFGIVKLVYHKDDQSKVYALKCVSKKQAVQQQQQKSIVVEREINAQCYHPCIMQFIKTFQDAKNVYFLTEFLGGGDLFYAIREIGNLSKDQCQFYISSIVLALEYLHARSILYRDLKPENVLLDFRGNAKLVDFGCCKQCLRTNTLVGTPEYFAPETILGKGYTCAIDWWAVGVMAHEFIVGPLPFGRDSEDQLDLFREILEAPLQFPKYITDETALSLITGLLERTPELRLGASTRGAKEIKDHAYFNDFDWDGIVGHTLRTPWTPDQRKLQQNWEMHEGEAVVKEGDADFQLDKEMEWASVF